jgi:hypothetical protein
MPSLTIKEARVILGGDKSAKLFDEQLQQLIWDLEVIAKESLKAIREGRYRLD